MHYWRANFFQLKRLNHEIDIEVGLANKAMPQPSRVVDMCCMPYSAVLSMQLILTITERIQSLSSSH